MTEQQPTPDTATSKAQTTLGGISTKTLAGAALAVSIVALGVSALPYAGIGIGPQVRSYLIANPTVLDEVVNARQMQEEQATVSEINAKVAENPALLAVDASDPSFGPADAKVTVIEFFDFRCGGCKAVAESYRKVMAENPDVRFVFKDWPILDRGDSVASQYAARAAVAAHQQGKYLEVYDALMAEPALDEAKVDAILAKSGVDMTKARAALISDEMTRHIANVHTSAASIGLRGTPTFFVNGKASPNIDPAAVNQMIQQAKAG